MDKSQKSSLLVLALLLQALFAPAPQAQATSSLEITSVAISRIGFAEQASNISSKSAFIQVTVSSSPCGEPADLTAQIWQLDPDYVFDSIISNSPISTASSHSAKLLMNTHTVTQNAAGFELEIPLPNAVDRESLHWPLATEISISCSGQVFSLISDSQEVFLAGMTHSPYVLIETGRKEVRVNQEIDIQRVWLTDSHAFSTSANPFEWEIEYDYKKPLLISEKFGSDLDCFALADPNTYSPTATISTPGIYTYDCELPAVTNPSEIVILEAENELEVLPVNEYSAGFITDNQLGYIDTVVPLADNRVAVRTLTYTPPSDPLDEFWGQDDWGQWVVVDKDSGRVWESPSQCIVDLPTWTGEEFALDASQSAQLVPLLRKSPAVTSKSIGSVSQVASLEYLGRGIMERGSYLNFTRFNPEEGVSCQIFPADLPVNGDSSGDPYPEPAFTATAGNDLFIVDSQGSLYRYNYPSFNPVVNLGWNAEWTAENLPDRERIEAPLQFGSIGSDSSGNLWLSPADPNDLSLYQYSEGQFTGVSISALVQNSAEEFRDIVLPAVWENNVLGFITALQVRGSHAMVSLEGLVLMLDLASQRVVAASSAIGEQPNFVFAGANTATRALILRTLILDMPDEEAISGALVLDFNADASRYTVSQELPDEVLGTGPDLWLSANHTGTGVWLSTWFPAGHEFPEPYNSGRSPQLRFFDIDVSRFVDADTVTNAPQVANANPAGAGDTPRPGVSLPSLGYIPLTVGSQLVIPVPTNQLVSISIGGLSLEFSASGSSTVVRIPKVTPGTYDVVATGSFGSYTWQGGVIITDAKVLVDSNSLSSIVESFKSNQKFAEISNSVSNKLGSGAKVNSLRCAFADDPARSRVVCSKLASRLGVDYEVVKLSKKHRSGKWLIIRVELVTETRS